ncbi:Transmembrane protein 135 [Cinnamomum micranthum f. kanehirae]|uniref:Transmembrane protein 135 n=1 Tax=Cinnamomum micranthum f. kanehirae TaxID=337451 RepID=A0A3S3P3E4_9MAGN|nr:Transmembrane protein 135 [Cinnamomum micranthum f. kanehirae]
MHPGIDDRTEEKQALMKMKVCSSKDEYLFEEEQKAFLMASPEEEIFNPGLEAKIRKYAVFHQLREEEKLEKHIYRFLKRQQSCMCRFSSTQRGGKVANIALPLNPQNKDNPTLSVSDSVISFMPPPSGGADESAGRCSCDSGHCSPEPDDGCCPYCRNQDTSSSSSPSSSLFSSSSSSSGLDLVSERDWEKLRRCLAAAGKGFAIGAGLKGGLSAFWLLSLLRSRRFSNALRKRGVSSTGEAAAMVLKETLRYGLFLGTFAGTFVSVDETASWRALVAGAIAGPSMLLTGRTTQHTSLAIYILMRASVLASRCGVKSKRFGNICKPLTWSHGDIFLMCLSSSQILSAYILKQDSLPSSYGSFLNKHGGKDSVILQGIKDMACSVPFTNLEGIEKHYKSMGVEIKLDVKMKVPCSIVHGSQSCWGHFILFLLQAYRRALPVYLPAWCNFGEGLSGYCKIEFVSLCILMWTCLIFRLFNECSIPLVAMGTFPTGLALSIEKKSRRIEISLYCLARAIESFFTSMTDAGYITQSKKLKRADVIIFSVSTAIIMHCYAQERDVFRSKYLNVLDWVFGAPPECEKEQKDMELVATGKFDTGVHSMYHQIFPRGDSIALYIKLNEIIIY